MPRRIAFLLSKKSENMALLRDKSYYPNPKLSLISLVIAFLSVCCGINAMAAPLDPDTPVSSDAISAPAATPSAGDEPASIAPGSGMEPANPGAEQSSQAKGSVSDSQEKKDRLFVDAIFTAVAVVCCFLAVILFFSLPKGSKKAGNDNAK